MPSFITLFSYDEPDKCPHCGNGTTLTSIIKRLTDGHLFKKTAWSGCLTYSARDDDDLEPVEQVYEGDTEPFELQDNVVEVAEQDPVDSPKPTPVYVSFEDYKIKMNLNTPMIGGTGSLQM